MPVYLVRVGGQQGFQGLQVVSVNDQIIIERRCFSLWRKRFFCIHYQLPERDAEVVGIDELFSFEFD